MTMLGAVSFPIGRDGQLCNLEVYNIFVLKKKIYIFIFVFYLYMEDYMRTSIPPQKEEISIFGRMVFKMEICELF
jgi:hypothetical protein